MATMNVSLYHALKEIGISDEKAEKASISISKEIEKGSDAKNLNEKITTLEKSFIEHRSESRTNFKIIYWILGIGFTAMLALFGITFALLILILSNLIH